MEKKLENVNIKKKITIPITFLWVLISINQQRTTVFRLGQNSTISC